MEFKSIKSLLIGFALSCGLSASAQDMTGKKFYVGVTSNGTTVSTTVYDDYKFEVVLPEANKTVSPAEATVDIKMNSVHTLGLNDGEISSFSSTFTTGATSTPVKLSEWLPNTYSFGGTDCKIDVIDSDGTESFTYQIDKSGNTITGVPSSNASAAWKKIISHTINGANSGDTNVKIINGTYILFGTDRIDFTQEYVAFKNEFNTSTGWTIGSTIQGVEDASTISTDESANENEIVLFLPASSTIAIGHRYAMLKDKATITISVPGENFSTLLNNLREALNGDRNTAIQTLFTTFDEIVSKFDGKEVSIKVDFGSAEGFITVYPGSEAYIPNQTVEEFLEIRSRERNAIGIVESQYADKVNGMKNILVQYNVGAYGNKFYECEYLELQDPSDVLADGGTIENANFYSPVNFIAINGIYSTPRTRYNNFICLPFAINASDISGNALLLTYAEYEYKKSDIEEEYVYFNIRDHINAGVPCLLFDNDEDIYSTRKRFEFNLNYTEIVGKPDNSANLQGAFIRRSLAQETKTYYGVSSKKDEEGKITEETLNKISNLNPFRGTLTTDSDTGFNDYDNHYKPNSGKLRIAIINENGDVTSISNYIASNKTKDNGIYTLSGTKIEKITNPGLYIINGVKTFVRNTK